METGRLLQPDGWKPEKSSVSFISEDGLEIILAYNWNFHEHDSTFLYWGKDNRQYACKFEEQKYGRGNIENYWREILRLRGQEELNLDSVYRTIERSFLSPLKVVKN